jgi:hypothetical protein
MPITVAHVVDLPDGIVTFIFTDVEGSTALWEDSPDSMMGALNQHDVAGDAEGRRSPGHLPAKNAKTRVKSERRRS